MELRGLIQEGLISRVGLDKVVEKILRENNLISNERFMYAVELYKFMSRDKLCQILSTESGRQVVSIEKEEVNRNESNKEIEKEHNIIVHVEDFNSAKIIVSICDYENLNISRVRLALPYSNIKIELVTPFNLSELKGDEIESWDYEILFKRLVLECISQKGTDIHLTVKHENKVAKYYVEFRIGNDLVKCDLFEITPKVNEGLVSTLIQKKTRASTLDLETTDGITTSANDFFGDGEVELRVTVNKVRAGYHCTCRIQKMSTVSLTVGELGFNNRVSRDLLDLSKKETGLTIITGAQRTGKNTTAFAIANEMVKRPLKIVDYSSPLEVLMPFTQVDYHSDVKVLVSYVRLAKKQDIDVVFINEIPDKEVAGAIQDLVNSSVHVVTTTHIDRLWHLPYKIYEYFGENYKNILSQLNGVVNQKMYVEQCKYCSEEVSTLTADTRYREVLERHKVPSYFVSKGCSRCDNGIIRTKLRPYAESLIFRDDIVSDLLSMSHPYEMEMYLRRKVVEKGTPLESVLCEAIGKGIISLESLESLGV